MALLYILVIFIMMNLLL